MKASVLTNYGSPDYFELQEVTRPVPKDSDVLIKVYATSINSWDWEILNGKPFINRLMVGLRKPTKITILGCDIAGRVEAVGENVKQFKPADEVFGDISRCGWGGLAEYVCAPANKRALALKPTSLSFEQAAAMPQAGVLALQGLRQGKIEQAQKVLINGASGGVGSFAVPMAKLHGADVTGVCRTGKMDFVHSLGADHVVDYTREDFTRNGQQYDLILDVHGHHSVSDYRHALTHNGRYVMVGGASGLIFQVMLLGSFISVTSGKKMGLLLHKPDANDLAILKGLIEEGKVTPIIDKCYSLNDVAEAFKYYGEGHVKGKVVIFVSQANGQEGNIMLTMRESMRAGAVIIAGAALGLVRFVIYDYVPPESLIRNLERSMFVTTGMQMSAKTFFAAVAISMMAVFFRLVQQRWPGRRGVKGLVFGASLGIIWSFGFFTGWAFLGTTLRADFLNSVVDLIALAFAGWLIGLAIGRDVPRSEHEICKPWLAVLLVAVGFVSVHALGAWLFAGLFTSTAVLLLVPETLAQIVLLAGLGMWVGVMYVMLRPGLPFSKTWARVAFFAFGVFGHSWTWFHVFFVIEFAGVLPVLLVVGLLGATGVFVGALAYEGVASGRRQMD